MPSCAMMYPGLAIPLPSLLLPLPELTPVPMIGILQTKRSCIRRVRGCDNLGQGHIPPAAQKQLARQPAWNLGPDRTRTPMHNTTAACLQTAARTRDKMCVCVCVGYKPVQDTAAECQRLMSSIAENQGWSVNSKAELCKLYLLGKAKSLLKGKWLWRPIAANPKPVLHKVQLKTAARAFTTFLRMLIVEFPMSFQVLRVTDVAQWYRWIDSMGLTTPVELDCKEQFNRVRPVWVVHHMRAASSWLYERKRWRSSELTWSIHKDHRRLDRAGKVCAQRFRYVTHDDLIRLVEFDLTSNNHCTAAEQVWERDGCIPMGGPFSAQAADLHCVWCAY